MTSDWEEKQLLQDIVDGLDAAIAEQNWDIDRLDPIKFNKLLYLAVKEFELPITFRWYKYGADFTPHGLQKSDLSGTPWEELPSPDEPRIGVEDSDLDIEPPTPNQVKEFYLEETPEIEHLFHDETKEYLRDFYDDYAPEDLKDLYRSCAVFQKSLDFIGRDDNPQRTISENIDDVLGELKELNREVFVCDVTADAEEQFQEYTELLKDVFVTVAENDDEISPRQEDVLIQLIVFFYDHAWKMVALKIAAHRAEGDNDLEWESIAVNRYLRVVSDYDDDLRSLRNQVLRAGLVADELLPYIDPVSRQADRSRLAELRDRTHREWSGLAGSTD